MSIQPPQPIQPLDPLAKLPASLVCRDCQHAVAYQMQTRQVKTYCQVMHLVSYDSQEPAELIISCNKQETLQQD